jgi:hypothetical protein
MKPLTILMVFAAGAACAYLFDPQQGRRRRALLRDKLYSQAKTVQDRAPKIAKDLRNRAQGVVAEVRRFAGRPQPHQGESDATRPAG